MATNTDTIPYQKQGEVIKNNSFIRCNKLSTVERKSFAIMLKETLDTISETGENRDFFSMPLKEYKRMMNYKDDIPTKQIKRI